MNALLFLHFDGYVGIAFGKEKHCWWRSALHEYFLVYSFFIYPWPSDYYDSLYTLLYFIIIKFKINIWLHFDKLDFYHSYQQMKMKSENNLQNNINS